MRTFGDGTSGGGTRTSVVRGGDVPRRNEYRGEVVAAYDRD
jgi:hypothetical protein